MSDDDSVDSTATPDAYINRISRNFMLCRVENDQLRSQNNELLSQNLRLVRNARELEQRMGALRIQYLELQSQNESTMAFDASLRESNAILSQKIEKLQNRLATNYSQMRMALVTEESLKHTINLQTFSNANLQTALDAREGVIVELRGQLESAEQSSHETNEQYLTTVDKLRQEIAVVTSSNSTLQTSCDRLESEKKYYEEHAEKVSHDLTTQVIKLSLENERIITEAEQDRIYTLEEMQADLDDMQNNFNKVQEETERKNHENLCLRDEIVLCNVCNESKDQEIARLKKLLSIAKRSSVTPGRQPTSVTPAPLSKRDKAMSATTESLPAESKSPKKKKAKTTSHEATCNAQPELAASALSLSVPAVVAPAALSFLFNPAEKHASYTEVPILQNNQETATAVSSSNQTSICLDPSSSSSLSSTSSSLSPPKTTTLRSYNDFTPKRKMAKAAASSTTVDESSDSDSRPVKRKKITSKSSEDEAENYSSSSKRMEIDVIALGKQWKKNKLDKDNDLLQLNEVLKSIGEGEDGRAQLGTFLGVLTGVQCKKIMRYNSIAYARKTDKNKDKDESNKSMVSQIQNAAMSEELMNQTNAVVKKKASAKSVRVDKMLECVEAVANRLSRVSHYTIEGTDGTTRDLELKYIIPRDDFYEFDLEEFRKASREAPDESLLDSIKEVRPDEKFLTESFYPCGNDIMNELVEILNALVGSTTEYKKDHDQLRKFLVAAIMPKIRTHIMIGVNAGVERDRTSQLEKDIALNEVLPGRGLNSYIDNWEDFKKQALSLIDNNEAASEMSFSDSHAKVKRLLEQLPCFTAADANEIMNSPPEEYVLKCLNSVNVDSIQRSKFSSQEEFDLAIQDAQHVRGQSGLSVWTSSHGVLGGLANRSLSGYGFKSSAEYPGGREGILGSLPVGEVFNPFCIGALYMLLLRGLWSEEDYKLQGPNVIMTITGKYFFDPWNCRLFRIYTRDELNGLSLPGGFFRNSIVPLGNDYFIGMYKRPKVQTLSGLDTYSYQLATKGRCNGRTTMQVHQLTELHKRVLQIDSRGQLMSWVTDRLGFPGQTPENIFPIIGRNACAEYEWEQRIEFIPNEDQNEISDVEHPLDRSELESNCCALIRATDHSTNCRIGTTQYHSTNGTGDHNFAHVARQYTSNSVADSKRRLKMTMYRHKKVRKSN